MKGRITVAAAVKCEMFPILKMCACMGMWAWGQDNVPCTHPELLEEDAAPSPLHYGEESLVRHATHEAEGAGLVQPAPAVLLLLQMSQDFILHHVLVWIAAQQLQHQRRQAGRLRWGWGVHFWVGVSCQRLGGAGVVGALSFNRPAREGCVLVLSGKGDMGLHGHAKGWGSIEVGLVVCGGDGAWGGGEETFRDGRQAVQGASEAVVSLQRRGWWRSYALQLEPVGSYQSLLLLLQGPVSLVHGAKFIPPPTHAVCTHRCHTRDERWKTDLQMNQWLCWILLQCQALFSKAE